MKKLVIPAISQELRFIAEHFEEAADIVDGNVKIDPLLERITHRVYKCAEEDVAALLEQLKQPLQTSVNGLQLNNWHPRYSVWEVYSDIFSGSKGPKRKVGYAGLHIGRGGEGFRLIGFMRSRFGGLDGQKKLAWACQTKMKQIHLTRDREKKYPGWYDCVIWLDKTLTVKTSLQELETELRNQAKTFFKIVRPLLLAK